MKRMICFITAFCCFGSPAFAQVSPAATSSTTTAVARGLQYALRYSESAQFSGGFNTVQSSSISGDIAFTSRNTIKPFVMDYAGGYTWNLSGPDFQSGQFHRLYLDQGFDYRRWKFNLEDDVSYLPQTPITGFSGVPGTGEIIGLPNPSPSNSQTILTLNTHVLYNNALASVEHALNYSTTVGFSGNSNVLHYPNNDGIDTRGTSGNAILMRRLSGRTTLLGSYNFTQYDFQGTALTMRTQTALAGVRHMFTRNLVMDLRGGPQLIDSTITSVIPANNTYYVNAMVTYSKRESSMSGSYFHGTTGGSGFLIGGIVDSGQGNYLRRIGQNVTLGFTSGYSRTGGLNNNGTTDAAYGAAQANWMVGRNLIVFANYTGMGQSASSLLPGSALNQMFNAISFGFGLSSRESRVRP